MVYLGLQDDDEYGYDGYADGYDQGYGVAQGYDDGYGATPAGRDQAYAEPHAEAGGGNSSDRYAPRPYADPRGGDVRPLGDVRTDERTVAVREHPGSPGGPGAGGGPSRPPMGESAVRPLPRDEQPSGVTVSRPAVVRAVPTTAAKVHVVEPRGFNDAQEVGDRVKANQAVILNLQSSPKDLRRRLIDFSSGLAYAMGGSMSRVADAVFLITPLNVQLSEEEKDRLEARGLYRRD
jgi:FtsZ-interacting cell division protein YlmF